MQDNIFDKVHDVDLKKTMEDSYIDYAMPVSSVIPWVNIIPMETALSMERW